MPVAEAGDRCGWPAPTLILPLIPTLSLSLSLILILILSLSLSLSHTERTPAVPADPAEGVS